MGARKGQIVLIFDQGYIQKLHHDTWKALQEDKQAPLVLEKRVGWH